MLHDFYPYSSLLDSSFLAASDSLSVQNLYEKKPIKFQKLREREKNKTNNISSNKLSASASQPFLQAVRQGRHTNLILIINILSDTKSIVCLEYSLLYISRCKYLEVSLCADKTGDNSRDPCRKAALLEIGSVYLVKLGHD